jgi:hypothetical protein
MLILGIDSLLLQARIERMFYDIIIEFLDNFQPEHERMLQHIPRIKNVAPFKQRNPNDDFGHMSDEPEMSH